MRKFALDNNLKRLAKEIIRRALEESPAPEMNPNLKALKKIEESDVPTERTRRKEPSEIYKQYKAILTGLDPFLQSLNINIRDFDERMIDFIKDKGLEITDATQIKNVINEGIQLILGGQFPAPVIQKLQEIVERKSSRMQEQLPPREILNDLAAAVLAGNPATRLNTMLRHQLSKYENPPSSLVSLEKGFRTHEVTKPLPANAATERGMQPLINPSFLAKQLMTVNNNLFLIKLREFLTSEKGMQLAADPAVRRELGIDDALLHYLPKTFDEVKKEEATGAEPEGAHQYYIARMNDLFHKIQKLPLNHPLKKAFFNDAAAYVASDKYKTDLTLYPVKYKSFLEPRKKRVSVAPKGSLESPIGEGGVLLDVIASPEKQEELLGIPLPYNAAELTQIVKNTVADYYGMDVSNIDFTPVTQTLQREIDETKSHGEQITIDSINTELGSVLHDILTSSGLVTGVTGIGGVLKEIISALVRRLSVETGIGQKAIRRLSSGLQDKLKRIRGVPPSLLASTGEIAHEYILNEWPGVVKILDNLPEPINEKLKGYIKKYIEEIVESFTQRLRRETKRST